MPGCLKEEKKKKLEEDGRSSNDQSEECSDHSDPDMAWKKSISGVRAKSANAVILTSPFGSSEKDKVTFQIETEAPSESSERPKDRKQKLETEGEAGAAGEEGIQMENQKTTDTEKENERGEDDDKILSKNPECVYVNTDIIPYLSIGTNPNNPSPEDESTKDPSQSSQTGKVIGRISTWPATAAQWQARCKMKEGEEEDGEGITVWTQSEVLQLSNEVGKIKNKMKQPESSELCEKEDETEKNHSEAHVNLRDSLVLRASTTEEQLKKEGMVQDPATVRQKKIKISQNQELKSAENPTHKSSSTTEVKPDLKRGGTGRRRAENRATGSKAPSGGASPDDETLLSGNEYAFMDLLHEVAQNNGRWTRERWKQMHINKQRR
ncbi:uncharacterized protein LOC121649655 [Melanotaenia boesemani]|uniref:uncharacterized protein LOC121649655 n=1 Tax=Melanotaenia boesemani TaxID=1250792 RepID=UPI001C0504D6|nr:uncharacterized protein LOC121649655 [Melanotaenia boesemani]